MNDNVYLKAFSLSDAVFEFGNVELIAIHKNSQKIMTPEIKENSILGILNEGLKSFQAINDAQNERNTIYNQLKSEIIKLIQKGELVAFGYEVPLKTNAEPIQIQPYLFSGEINWDNSELKFKNLEFTGIKALKAETKENYALENIELENKLNSEIKKQKQITDLDPQGYLTEKELAPILNISPRTLKGRRVKGGGIAFHKIGEKSVRYKVADVLEWLKNKKKENTI